MNVRVLPLFFLCGSYREEPCCPASIQSDVPSAVILRAYGYMRKKWKKHLNRFAVGVFIEFFWFRREKEPAGKTALRTNQ